MLASEITKAISIKQNEMTFLTFDTHTRENN